MTYRGIAKGKTIELNEALPCQNGQAVAVLVEVIGDEAERGSPSAVLRAMDSPPHLSAEAVDQMLRAIEEGRLPVHAPVVFDESPTQ